MADRLTETIRGIVPTSVKWRPENLAPNDGGALNSSYTEKDPRPGTAVTADSRARLRPEISQAQEGGTLVFTVTEGGLPGSAGAAVSYRREKEAGDLARGWNQPNLLGGWLTQEWSDVVVYDDVACVTIPRTQQVVGFVQDNGGAAGLATTRIFDPEGWTWSAATAVPWKVLTGINAVGLVHLPGTDRILAVIMPATAGPGSFGIMQVWATENAGITWEEYSLRPIRDPATDPSGSGFGVGVRRAKAAAQSDGSVLVVVESGGLTDAVAQMASADLGVTFALVEPAVVLGTNIDVLALPDQTYALTFVEETTGLPRIRFLGSAFDPISSAVEVSIASAQLVSMTATIDADGTIYVFGGRDTAFRKVFVWRSTDLGRTWTQFDYGLIDTGDNSAFPVLTGSCATGGYILIQHQWTASVGNEDGSVATLLAGGWSNLSSVDKGFFAIPGGNPAAGPRQVGRFGFGSKIGVESNTWLPIELPGDTVYTAVGAPGVLEAPGRMRMISAASGDPMILTTSTGVEDIVVLAQFAIISGGSQGGPLESGFRVEVSDPAVPISFIVEIRADVFGFAVHDSHGGADIGTVSLNMAVDNQILLHVYFSSGGTVGHVRTYYRVPGRTLWTAGPSTDTLTSAAAAATLTNMAWVHPAITTTTSTWTIFEWAFEAGVAFGVDQVDGKRIADLPYPLLEVGDAATGEKALLALRAGPGTRGEIYEIAAEADHAVSKLFPTVSPSRDDTFETLTNTVTRVSVDMSRDTRLGQSFALVMGVLGSNVRRIQLFGDIAAVPTLIGEIDLATGFVGLDYILDGDTLHPNTATTIDAGRWIQAMEFVGGHVLIGGSAYKILSNSGGGWTQSTTAHPHFRIEIVGVSPPATGTCDLVAPSGFVVFHMATTASRFRQFYAVEIPGSQATPEGRYIVGNVLLGGLVVPGKQWSNGWALSYAGNVRSRRDPYGTEYREQRGPEARTYTVGFADGVKLQHTRESLDVAYIGSSAVGASALAGRDDVLGQLVGLLRESEGFSAPSMLLAEVPDASGVTVTDPTLWVYGYLTGTVQANHVTGNENSREFYRIEQLQLVEVR